MSNHHQRHILYLPHHVSFPPQPHLTRFGARGGGVPPVDCTVHVYIGYGVFIFTMVSQSVIGMEPLHMITYIINWAFIAAHIVLSFRFMLQRVRKSQVDPMLELTVSKRLREPVR